MNFIPSMQEALGWTAAVLTLLAFSCSDILRLRYAALAANGAFIAYGFAAELWPVLALHLLLVPINLCRLIQTRRLCASAARGKSVFIEPFVAPPPATPVARAALANDRPPASQVRSMAHGRGLPQRSDLDDPVPAYAAKPEQAHRTPDSGTLAA